MLVSVGPFTGGGDVTEDTIWLTGAFLFAVSLTSENCLSQDSLILCNGKTMAYWKGGLLR